MNTRPSRLATTKTPASLAWRKLHFAGRVTTKQVDALLRRLAQPDAPRPLVFETEATCSGPRWYCATSSSRLDGLHALARDFLGARLQPLDRDDRQLVDAAHIVLLRRLPVPLDHGRSEPITVALYSALARVHGDKRLRLQLVVGRGHAPHLASGDAAGSLGVLDALLRDNSEPASGRLRTRLEARAALPSLEVSVRIGVRAGHPSRRQELALGVFGALRLLETAGTELRLRNDTPRRF